MSKEVCVIYSKTDAGNYAKSVDHSLSLQGINLEFSMDAADELIEKKLKSARWCCCLRPMPFVMTRELNDW